MPVEELTLWDDNPHEGDVDAIRASLRRFGQVVPIVRAPDGWIPAGNHTLIAMRREGFTHAAVVTKDGTREELTALALALNKIARMGADDDGKVYELLSSLDDLDGTGYNLDDLGDLRAMLSEADPSPLAPPERPAFINPETGLRDGESTYDEYLDRYAAHTVRAMILNYDLDVYRWVQDQAATLRTELDVATNADLFVRLIAGASGHEPPAVVLTPDPETEL